MYPQPVLNSEIPHLEHLFFPSFSILISYFWGMGDDEAHSSQESDCVQIEPWLSLHQELLNRC